MALVVELNWMARFLEQFIFFLNENIVRIVGAFHVPAHGTRCVRKIDVTSGRVNERVVSAWDAKRVAGDGEPAIGTGRHQPQTIGARTVKVRIMRCGKSALLTKFFGWINISRLDGSVKLRVACYVNVCQIYFWEKLFTWYPTDTKTGFAEPQLFCLVEGKSVEFSSSSVATKRITVARRSKISVTFIIVLKVN